MKKLVSGEVCAPCGLLWLCIRWDPSKAPTGVGRRQARISRQCLITREPAGHPASGGTSNGADCSRSEREGVFGIAAITAEVRYPLSTKH